MTLVSKGLDLERLRWPVLGLLATFAVAAVLNATRAVTPEHGLIVLLGVVMIAAWWGGFSTGVAATVTALLVTAYAMPPINSLRIASWRDAIYLGLAAIQGLLISQLCGRLRRHRLGHRAMLAEMVELSRRADSDRRRLADMHDDLQRLQAAIPLRIGPALDSVHQARAVLSANGACVQAVDAIQKLTAAEQQVAAFAKALEDYSHVPAAHTGEPIPSARVLTAAIRAAEQAASKDSVRFVFPEHLPAVEMRENDLLRVFTEVLSNAIRYQSQDAPLVRIHSARQRNCWVFSISDQGPGMIPLRASRAFVLFGGDDPDRLGVGLAISRRIVRSYGGEMWIESRQALGSTVYFTIPQRCP
jgi:K+-sensing histidine kinase KdpD